MGELRNSKNYLGEKKIQEKRNKARRKMVIYSQNYAPRKIAERKDSVVFRI